MTQDLVQVFGPRLVTALTVVLAFTALWVVHREVGASRAISRGGRARWLVGGIRQTCLATHYPDHA